MKHLLFVLTNLCLASCALDDAEPDHVNEQAQNQLSGVTTCEAKAQASNWNGNGAALNAACARDDFSIARYAFGGLHGETWLAAGGVLPRYIEAVYSFGAQPGAGRFALWHCQSPLGGGVVDDFVSSDPNCEGRANRGFFGYSLPGGRPVYRCLVGGRDHMLSWDPGCEGKRVEGVVGYARW